MKYLFLLIVLLITAANTGCFSQVQTNVQYPYYDMMPPDSVRFYRCQFPENCKDSSLPIIIPTETLYATFGQPDLIRSGESSDWCLYNYNEETWGSELLYLRYNDKVPPGYRDKSKFEIVDFRIDSNYSFTFNSYTLNSRTTVEDISRMFPLSYKTSLEEWIDYHNYVFTTEPPFGITLRALPGGGPLYYIMKKGTLSPYWTLMFADGKLAYVIFRDGT